MYFNFIREIPTGRALLLAIVAIILVYLSYHLIQGKRGVSSLFYAQENIEKQQHLLIQLQAQRFNLESKVKMLQMQSIEADFLEELAKEKLGLAERNEVVYIIKPSKS